LNINHSDHNITHIALLSHILQNFIWQTNIPFNFLYLYTSELECKDRAIQQRVRRFHTKLDKGIINADTFNDVTKEFQDTISFVKKACEFLTKSTDPFLAVKTCSEQLLENGFVKLSKREPFAGKLVPGEMIDAEDAYQALVPCVVFDHHVSLVPTFLPIF